MPQAAMTKKDVIGDIADNVDMPRTAVEKVIDDFVALIEDTMKAGGELAYPKLGKFTVKTRPAREGRNPHTGETVQIAAKQVVRFRPSTTLTRAANGGE